mgnify:CR=1 FL=1
MKYKTYPKMKDSGIEWVGEIPKEWDIKRLKFTTSFDNSTVDRHTYDDEIKVSICHYPQVYKNEVITSKTDLESGTCTKKELEKFQLKKDDVLITKDSETPTEIGIPVYIQENFGNVVSGYHIAHLTTNKNEILGSFLFRYLQSDIANGYFETEANGVTRFGLGKDSISNLKLILPPISEQANISKILQKQTSGIDSEISKHKKLIILLQEKRQATINHAVTKGLDNSVPMKDSGIEWVGDVPETWSVEPLKFHVSINQKVLNEKTESDLQISYIDIGSVHEGGIIDVPEIFKFSDAPSRAKRIISENDIILSTVRTYLKAIAFIEKENQNNICSTGFAVITPKDELIPKFLYFMISSEKYIQTIMSNSFGVTYPAINSSIIGTFPCIIPDLNEQKQITEFLDKQTSKIDKLISKAKLQIKTLQEYRQSLISSAVTGKICVTN